MPRALIVNPNTSTEMTLEIEATVNRVLRKPWTGIVASAPAGPESLESWTDYYIASLAVLPVLEKYSDIDGVVLACFGDPGLYLLKENCPVPVVGVAEASIAMALLLGAKFGILAGMRRAVGLMDSMVRTYGMEARYAGTEALDMRVLDFERDRSHTLNALEQACKKLRIRGAEVVLLGCAGLTGYVEELMRRIEMPALDPVEVGCRMLQSICDSGLETSHLGLYARPASQRMLNLETMFSEAMINVLRKPRS